MHVSFVIDQDINSTTVKEHAYRSIWLHGEGIHACTVCDRLRYKCSITVKRVHICK